MHMKRYEEALVAHGKALVLDPNNAEIVNNLGRALMGLERIEDAAHCFADALQLRPNYFDALINRGIALNGLKGFEQALSCFTMALELDPSCTLALTHRSRTLEGLERYDEAVADCDHAIARLPPNYAPPNASWVVPQKIGALSGGSGGSREGARPDFGSR